MYARQTPRQFEIPRNYSGSAFSPQSAPPPPPPEEETAEVIAPMEEAPPLEPKKEAEIPTGASPRSGLFRLFGRGRGGEIGGEELLLIGLCLLLSQSEAKDDLLILLLLLLLIQ